MKKKLILTSLAFSGVAASTIVVASCGAVNNATKLNNIVKTWNINVSDIFKNNGPLATNIKNVDLEITKGGKALNEEA